MLSSILLPVVSISFPLDVAIFILLVFLIVITLIISAKNRIIKESSDRIKATKEIVDNIHKNFDIKNIKEISVRSVGTVLEADRCLIAEYDTSTKKFSKVEAEYLSSEEIMSLKGDLPPIQATRVTNICINNKILNIPNTKKYLLANKLQDTLIESFYQKYDIKSVLGIPIRHSGKVLGAIVLHYTQNNKNFTGEDIKFVKGIADSIGVALYQSNLYEEERKISRRDSLLRQITEAIRSSLDMKEMKQSIVNEACKAFNADRCYLRAYDHSKGLFLEPEVEYLASPDIESLKGKEINQEALSYFFNQVENKKGYFPIQVTSHTIAEKEFENSAMDEYFKQANIKSDFAVPIWDRRGKLTFLVLHYVKESFKLNAEDTEFLMALAKQISIALNQAAFYNEAKIQAEKERITRKIVDIIRSSIELNNILTNIATELLKYFDEIQRIFVGQINFKLREHFIEVAKNHKIKKISLDTATNYDALADYWADYIDKYKTKKIIYNIENSDIPSDIKKIYTDMGVKSFLAMPIKVEGKIWGGIFLSSIDNYKKWSPDEIEFLESIITQLDVAIRQAELFESLTIANKRNNAILNNMPFMAWLKDKQGIYISVNKKFCDSFNLKSEDIIGKTDEMFTPKELADKYQKDDQEVIQLGKQKIAEETIITEKGIGWSETFKSPVIDDKGNIIGTVGIARDITERKEFELQLKQSAERERFIRETIAKCASTFDLTQIKQIVNDIGRITKADRCYIVEVDLGKMNGKPVSQDEEYLSSSDIPSIVGYDFPTEEVERFVELYLSVKDLVFFDYEAIYKEKTEKYASVKKYKTIFNLKSGIGIPFFYMDKLIAILAIEYVKEKILPSDNELNFLRIIGNQIGIAFNQALLYQKEKQMAQREKTLRELVTMIRQSLDIKEIITSFVSETGKMFGFQRVFFSKWNEVTRTFYTPDVLSEYLDPPESRSYRVLGEDFSEEYGFFVKALSEKRKNVFFEDRETFIKEYGLENTPDAKNLRLDDAGSVICIPIIYKDNLLGIYVAAHKQPYAMTQEIVNYLESISEQIAIALYQAELLETKQQSLERELLVKEITENIRSSLDIKQRKKAIVNSIGKSFGADRCTIMEKDPKTDNLIVLDEYSEYLCSPDIKSYVDFDSNKYGDIPSLIKIHEKIKEVYIENSEEFIKKNHLEGTSDEKFLIESSTKSALGLSLYYENTYLGILALFYTKRFKTFTEEDKNLLRILSIQVANALHQSNLYEFQIKTARKESILKDIISEIKLTRDLKHAYDALLYKLADIFDLNRTLFLESSQINPDELDIKYEYVIDRKDMSVNNLIFPQVCIDEFLNLIHNLQPLILDDVSKCYPEETSDFFQKHKIQALMSVPLVKYNGEAKVLGFIVLCSEETRKWTDEEIDLIKAIAENVISVIWEITKFIETEELRNSFILTLAHDFQVPLIGERTAIEYLMNYSECSFGTNKEILQEILENNQNISILLEKSVAIYNYESGKQNLELENIKLGKILNEAILIAKSGADLKKIKINLEKDEGTYWVNVDKKELMKVFSILIENAIQHSPDEDEIQIKYYKKSKRIIISINNGGKPIPKDIQEKIFKRYEMAHAIERKIGAGTGLFLCKRIVEAHKGAIWFDTGKKTGTTFYISLPFINVKE